MSRINTFRYLSVVKPFCLTACVCCVAWCADCSIVFECTLACVLCMFVPLHETIEARVVSREEGETLEVHEREVSVEYPEVEELIAGFLEEDQGQIANQGKPPSCSCPLTYCFQYACFIYF